MKKIFVIIASVLLLAGCGQKEQIELEVVCPVPEAVDLGLSVKWSSFNLGATKPEEFGGLYQWAGLKDVTNKSYLWDNCPFHTGSDYDTGWTKYILRDKSSYWSGPGNPDNKTVLDLEDDVAHVKLGGKWRMPNSNEFDELINNCNSVWTTLNGVEGRLFTSKKNGNSIFLPAAGCVDINGIIGSSENPYWASNISREYPENAFYFSFDSWGVSIGYYCFRWNGLPVRPVSE